MEQTKSDIIFKLKEIRNKLSLTQEALAHQLGVSFTSINRWENGQTTPSPLARRKIEELLKKIQKTHRTQIKVYYEDNR